jgi:glycosyltransferase involved in cell wall biosynthesis
MIVLLGRKDVPTDGVEDYCRCLSREMRVRGYNVEILRVDWDELGWIRSCRRLWRKSREWKGQCLLAQYTALMWSRRGFPLWVLVVLWLLKLRQMRIAVVFHDPEPYGGRRLVDRVRRCCQRSVMCYTYWLADRLIFTVPVNNVSWLPRKPSKTSFIPVGANIPAIVSSDRSACNSHEAKTIVIFGITGDGSVGNEASDIAFAAKAAAKHVPGLRLITLGRGSRESELRFRQALEGSAVEYSALGILPAEKVSQVLANSDVALFVRGPISTQKGSAIASIACGLPLVAYSDTCLPTPFAEAGVVGVRCGDRQGLAEATIRILADRQLWLELHQRSQTHFGKYFSWESIAARFVELFDHA